MQSHPSVRASLSSFFALVESQAVFAISEISRGLAIFFLGDFVTADEVAELIIIGVSARIAVAERVVFAFGQPMSGVAVAHAKDANLGREPETSRSTIRTQLDD